MGKFLVFTILYALTGNPILAVVFILIMYFVVDRTFLGFIPDPFKAFRKSLKIRELRKAVSINPADGRALKELGILMVEKGDFRKSLGYFRDAEAKMSDDPEFNYYHGIAVARSGDIRRGKELVERALRVSRALKYGEPYLMLAEIHIERGDYESALPLLEEFMKIHSSSSRGCYQMGIVKMKLGRKDEGMECLKESISHFKASPFFKRKTDRKWAWKSRILLRQAAYL